MAVHIKNEFGSIAKNANQQQQAINRLHILSAKIVLHFSRTVGPFANATLTSYYVFTSPLPPPINYIYSFVGALILRLPVTSITELNSH